MRADHCHQLFSRPGNPAHDRAHGHFQYLRRLRVRFALYRYQGQAQPLVYGQLFQGSRNRLHVSLTNGQLFCRRRMVHVIDTRFHGVSVPDFTGSQFIDPGVSADPVGPFRRVGIFRHALFQDALYGRLQ